MASRRNGTLYVGVTRDLIRRVWDHKSDSFEGFTKRYGVHMLVWYESTPYLMAAIQKEKQLKLWHRPWKLRLIEKTNPEWKALVQRASVKSGCSPARHEAYEAIPRVRLRFSDTVVCSTLQNGDFMRAAKYQLCRGLT
jgi:putative endonuclease